MRVYGRLILASLLAIAAVDAQSPRPPSNDPQNGLIVGQVIDADTGKPIRDAVVFIPSFAMDRLVISRPGTEPPVSQQILTGADGRFVFRDLARGSFNITATKPGYVEGAYGRRRPGGPSQQLTLAEGERLGDVVLHMWKHAAISGTIVDEAGEALVGTHVVAYRRTVISGLRRFVGAATGTTDDRGIYRISGLAPGDYVVGVTSRRTAVPMELGDRLVGGNNGTVRMSAPPGTASAMQIGGSAYSLGSGAPTPRIAGERLFVYPPSFFSSTFSASQATLVTVASGEDRTAVDFQLSPVPTVRVSGVVMGPDGEVPAMPLRVFAGDANDVGLVNELFTIATDGYGRFTIPAVPEGRYVLQAGTAVRPPMKPGDAGGAVLWAETPLPVAREDIDGVVVTLQRGLRISGHFDFEGALARPTGAGLDQVPISIEPADPGSGFVMPSPAARADSSGRFTTVGIPPGRYFVRVRGSPVGWMFKTATYGGRDVADAPLDLSGNDATGVVITFTDRWTGVRGAVTLPSGRHTADALVILYPTDPQYWTNYGQSVRRIKSARTSRTGEYVFNSVPIGSYYIVAVPDERAGDWQDPAFLQALTSIATPITIHDGDKRVQNLQIRGGR